MKTQHELLDELLASLDELLASLDELRAEMSSAPAEVAPPVPDDEAEKCRKAAEAVSAVYEVNWATRQKLLRDIAAEIARQRQEARQTMARLGVNQMHRAEKDEDELAAARRQVEQLTGLIGTAPEGSHPDEQLPRDKTWHQERLNWIGEVDAMRRVNADAERRGAEKLRDMQCGNPPTPWLVNEMNQRIDRRWPKPAAEPDEFDYQSVPGKLVGTMAVGPLIPAEPAPAQNPRDYCRCGDYYSTHEAGGGKCMRGPCGCGKYVFQFPAKEPMDDNEPVPAPQPDPCEAAYRKALQLGEWPKPIGFRQVWDQFWPIAHAHGRAGAFEEAAKWAERHAPASAITIANAIRALAQKGKP